MPGTVAIEGNNLVFEMHGMDEIFAVKRRIDVPLEHVVSVSTERAPWKALRQIRSGGTAVPWVIKDGRFFDLDEGMMFFEVHDPEKCIIVKLDHEKYKKIVFEVEDKNAAAKMITEALELLGK